MRVQQQVIIEMRHIHLIQLLFRFQERIISMLLATTEERQALCAWRQGEQPASTVR